VKAPDLTPGCQACAAAAANPTSGLYTAGCTACGARQAANSIPYAATMTGKVPTPEYRARLAAIAYPGEEIEQTHARVRAWDKAIFEFRMRGGVEEGVML